MNFILDTSILIAIKRQEKSILEKLYALSINTETSPAITTFCYAEHYFGLLNKTEKNILKEMDFLSSFSILTLTPKSARIWAELQKKYKSKGKSIPLLDLFNAAIAIEHGRSLITKDRDYQPIEELQKVIL